MDCSQDSSEGSEFDVGISDGLEEQSPLNGK